MNIVFKLISGEEIIGRIDCDSDEDFNALEKYDLIDPMWIVPSENGSMKLRDATMLAESSVLLFYSDMIITCYKPSVHLLEYYKKAIIYSEEFTRSSINNQINLATYELEQSMKEEREYSAKLGDTLRKMTGSKLH